MSAGPSGVETSDLRVYFDEIEAFRRRRERSLTAPDGWLSLVARYVLEPGANDVGDGTARLLDDGTVRLELDRGTQGTVDGEAVDSWVWRADEPAPHLFVGQRRYEIMRQGSLVALRVRDAASEARSTFSGIPVFATDARYRVTARLEPAAAARRIAVATGLGAMVEYDCPGTLHFALDGRELSLDPVIEPSAPGLLFVIFRDATAPRETYGAGRFLYVAAPGPDGTTTLDFNCAYNPPCAFTAFASCPMPPPQNELPVRIEAGEKTPH